MGQRHLLFVRPQLNQLISCFLGEGEFLDELLDGFGIEAIGGDVISNPDGGIAGDEGVFAAAKLGILIEE